MKELDLLKQYMVDYWIDWPSTAFGVVDKQHQVLSTESFTHPRTFEDWKKWKLS